MRSVCGRSWTEAIQGDDDLYLNHMVGLKNRVLQSVTVLTLIASECK